MIEAPTISGFVIAMLGTTYVALAVARLVPKSFGAIAQVFFRFLPMIPIKLLRDVKRSAAPQSGGKLFGETLRFLVGWALPLGLGTVFLLLFCAANPLIEISLRNIDLALLLQFLDIRRLGFWYAAASLIWAMAWPRLIDRPKTRFAKDAAACDGLDKLLNHAGLVRSLCVFNLLFTLQTMLDLTYLWGGADLPSGMSHAQYAHRGAYPLLATALLAGAFVLIAMRRGGPGDKSWVIRALVVAWIAQNVLLCLSSILRLDLYVKAYSLTGLRMAAGIWMGLVAAGLIFILLRIVLRRSNDWLVSMNLVALLTVLYLAAFVDLQGFIARFNVENSIARRQTNPPLDIDYLASLGSSAIPALDLYLASAPSDNCERLRAIHSRDRLAAEFAARSPDWRSWSYRIKRMNDYVQSTALIARENNDTTDGVKFLGTTNGSPYPCRR